MAKIGVPFNPADLLGPEIPEKPQITITLERQDLEDVIWLTQCVDPLFDMQMISEALATQIVIAAKYSNRTPEQVLKEVVDILTNVVKFRGTVRRSES